MTAMKVVCALDPPKVGYLCRGDIDGRLNAPLNKICGFQNITTSVTVIFLQQKRRRKRQL